MMSTKSYKPIRDSYLVFGQPQILEPEIDEVLDSLQSAWIGTGPKVGRFEENFRRYIGAEHALALNSCTAGLHLCMLAAGIGPGDEVITTPMTFCATVNSIIHTGATPVLVDCERDTQLIDPKQIEAAITPRTRAIIPVHLCGLSCDMDVIMDIASHHSLVVIEDAAHAIETVYKGQKIGTIGHMTVFSFYATKNVTTAEGGMVTTNIPDYAEKVKIYGLHGLSRDAWKRYSDDGFKHYQVVMPGYKYNMTDLQAAIGLHQLNRVEQNLLRRNEVWAMYDQALKNLPIDLPVNELPGVRHARHLYTIMVDKERTGVTRDEFMQALHEQNIGTGVHYLGVHLHPYYQSQYGLRPEDFPNATWLSERTVSLPLSPKLANADVENVIEAIYAVVGQ